MEAGIPPDKLAIMMTGITGAHILLNSDKPEADRAFFRDVLDFMSECKSSHIK